MGAAKKDFEMVGKTFSRLTVTSRGNGRIHGTRKRTTWICKCSCGKIVEIDDSSLCKKKSATTSCGCYAKEVTSKVCIDRNLTHGRSKDRVYKIWFGIIRRCTDSTRKDFNRYGGRGIAICDRWLKFENFLEDMGECPSGCSVERDRVNGNYEPSNCRWATTKEQANNKRSNKIFIVNGESLTLMQVSEKFNINYRRLQTRLVLGWSIEEAIKCPKKVNQYK